MKKTSYQKLKEKYDKDVKSLTQDIAALVGDDVYLRTQTAARWSIIFNLEKAVWFGACNNPAKGQGLMALLKDASRVREPLSTEDFINGVKHMFDGAAPLNPVLANEHTPMDNTGSYGNRQ